MWWFLAGFILGLLLGATTMVVALGWWLVRYAITLVAAGTEGAIPRADDDTPSTSAPFMWVDMRSGRPS